MSFIGKIPSSQAHRMSELPENWNDLPFPEHQPDTLLIACVDARLPINNIGFTMGKTLINREIAAFVPYNQTNRADMEATLEFAVKSKKIRRIVVMGHTDCGGIRACLEKPHDLPKVMQYLEPLKGASKMVEEQGGDIASQARKLEQEAVRLSLANLRQYDFIREAEAADKLVLEGYLLDVRGENKAFTMFKLDEKDGVFKQHFTSIAQPQQSGQQHVK